MDAGYCPDVAAPKHFSRLGPRCPPDRQPSVRDVTRGGALAFEALFKRLAGPVKGFMDALLRACALAPTPPTHRVCEFNEPSVGDHYSPPLTSLVCPCVSLKKCLKISLCDEYSLPVDFVNKRRPHSFGAGLANWTTPSPSGDQVEVVEAYSDPRDSKAYLEPGAEASGKLYTSPDRDYSQPYTDGSAELRGGPPEDEDEGVYEDVGLPAAQPGGDGADGGGSAPLDPSEASSAPSPPPLPPARAPAPAPRPRPRSRPPPPAPPAPAPARAAPRPPALGACAQPSDGGGRGRRARRRSRSWCCCSSRCSSRRPAQTPSPLLATG
ncbi:Uncharacterized protein GBIM_11233 [Gryllus bimaculatus]|nr:Uncharacterized protein GBIM_11233 [Gryllus bimaculatus]